MAASSYQNGGSPPHKPEAIEISTGMLHRRKSARRRFLLAGVSFVSLVAMAAMAVLVYAHQQQQDSLGNGGGGNSGYFDDDAYDDDDNNGVGGRGRIPRTFDNKVISLDDLNLRTNTSLPSGCETTVVLIRHCEKQGDETVDEDGNEHCSYLGYERAHYIPSLFRTSPGGNNNNTSKTAARWPVPTALFALTPQRSNHFNFREVETLVPLANEYGIPIESDFPNNKHMTKRLFQGLSTGDWCGKLVVVAWKHSFLGDLAQQLGCVDCPDDYPYQVFDEVWQLKYVYDVQGTPIIQASHMHPTSPTPPLLGDASPKSQNNNLRRELKTKKKGKKTKTKRAMPGKKWSVYSTITHQNFDPLHVSFTAGDFDGRLTGGKWYEANEGRVPQGQEPSEGEM